MLELDPEERYNAEDILSHEFLDEAESEPSEKELVSPATTYGGAEQFVL
jgi:serine/threonine protein kinase